METLEEKPVKVFLGGKLGKIFGHVWEFYVKSPAEAIRAINANTKGNFLRHIQKHGLYKYYKIAVNNTKNTLTENELQKEQSMDSLYITPTIKGKSAVTRIIIGVVLIIIGVVLMFTPFAPLGGYLIGAGIGLVVGGIISLLTPIPTPPKERTDTELQQSRILANQKAIDQGLRLPIIYGRGIVGAVTVSAASNSYDKVVYQPPIPNDYDQYYIANPDDYFRPVLI